MGGRVRDRFPLDVVEVRDLAARPNADRPPGSWGLTAGRWLILATQAIGAGIGLPSAGMLPRSLLLPVECTQKLLPISGMRRINQAALPPFVGNHRVFQSLTVLGPQSRRAARGITALNCSLVGSLAGTARLSLARIHDLLLFGVSGSRRRWAKLREHLTPTQSDQPILRKEH